MLARQGNWYFLLTNPSNRFGTLFLCRMATIFEFSFYFFMTFVTVMIWSTFWFTQMATFFNFLTFMVALDLIFFFVTFFCDLMRALLEYNVNFNFTLVIRKWFSTFFSQIVHTDRKCILDLRFTAKDHNKTKFLKIISYVVLFWCNGNRKVSNHCMHFSKASLLAWAVNL